MQRAASDKVEVDATWDDFGHIGARPGGENGRLGSNPGRSLRGRRGQGRGWGWFRYSNTMNTMKSSPAKTLGRKELLPLNKVIGS